MTTSVSKPAMTLAKFRREAQKLVKRKIQVAHDPNFHLDDRTMNAIKEEAKEKGWDRHRRQEAFREAKRERGPVYVIYETMSIGGFGMAIIHASDIDPDKALDKFKPVGEELDGIDARVNKKK